jgi:hypothetical protein
MRKKYSSLLSREPRAYERMSASIPASFNHDVVVSVLKLSVGAVVSALSTSRNSTSVARKYGHRITVYICTDYRN